jgi:hypothetical protein
MSLIVARKYQNNIIIVGDSKITYPYLDKNNPKDGLVKSVIINAQLCISVAGVVDYGNEALQKIGKGKSKTEVIEILEFFHSKSGNETSFLVCFGNPHYKIIRIDNGVTESVQNGWIGSHPAFEKFQYYYHTPDAAKKLFEGLTTFKIHQLPDEFDENGRHIYSTMFASMNGVIEDPSILEVGGFIIPIVYEKNSFNYMIYVHMYRKPIDIDAEFPDGKGGIMKFGDAEDGAYCVNFSASNREKLALHICKHAVN